MKIETLKKPKTEPFKSLPVITHGTTNFIGEGLVDYLKNKEAIVAIKDLENQTFHINNWEKLFEQNNWTIEEKKKIRFVSIIDSSLSYEETISYIYYNYILSKTYGYYKSNFTHFLWARSFMSKKDVLELENRAKTTYDQKEKKLLTRFINESNLPSFPTEAVCYFVAYKYLSIEQLSNVGAEEYLDLIKE